MVVLGCDLTDRLTKCSGEVFRFAAVLLWEPSIAGGVVSEFFSESLFDATGGRHPMPHGMEEDVDLPDLPKGMSITVTSASAMDHTHFLIPFSFRHERMS